MPLSASFGACLRLAWTQLEEAQPDNADDVRPVLALASWINWAMTIDESLRSDRAYFGARQKAAGGQAIFGLRHTWNLLKHEGQRLQDLLIVNVQPDRATVTRAGHWSRLIPAAAYEARWKPFARLPKIAPGSKHHHPNQEQAYVTYLENRPVKATVEPIQTFLVGFC